MELSALTALSPLDGRYARQTESLRDIFSESAFMRARVRVEVEWLIALSEAGLPELNHLSDHGKAYLRGLVENFTVQSCQEIKDIEKTTNHDVKAVEYWIKEQVSHDEELARASEFVHFGCTSEDINNTSHALMLTEGRKIAKIPKDAPVIRWKEFMNMGKACFWNYSVERTGDDPAVILYSGGTTGTTKGIVLTNKNFNALGQQVIAANPMFRPGDRMLAAMPLFHGFGLGVCVHTMLSQGGRCILIPRFTAKSYAKQIVKYKCNFIAGVPTLYEALLRLPSMDGANLSSLKGVFSGGDSLSIELKKKFDKFLYDHKASIQVREGYGTTETVTACCLTPPHMFKEGSIGLPFPDTYIKIVELDTDREVPYGQEGEILLAGPTVMKEYMNNPEETAQTLRTHADGLTWVYTGDLGVMDEQGFIYFRGRAKRMIISSGYNVYPSQIENILDAHEYVQMSCVIGVPDPYKMQKVKAFVKLAQGVPATEETKQVLMAYCRKNVAKYAMPYDIEFKEDMPKTLVGKVAYRQLEEEELAKIKAAEEK